MASITKRGNKWQARVSYYTSDQKRHFKNKSGFATKKEAMKWATENESAINNGYSLINADTPFDEYFWNWFEQFKESNVSERTKATYRQTFNALHKHLLIPIGKINRKAYRYFLSTYGRNHAKSTVSKYNSLYHACVKEALYDGDIKRDFIENVDLVYDKTKSRKVDYLSVAEVKKLYSYINQTRDHYFTAKYMILTALLTGVRLGEIQALTWDDINFNFKTVTINRAWYEPTKSFKDTKNESSNRIIRVNKTLRESLAACNIDKKGFHFHSLRHTHVAYLLSESVDIYAIAKRLGHSGVTTTRVSSYLI